MTTPTRPAAEVARCICALPCPLHGLARPAGWIEVTDDPATWPDESEHVNGPWGICELYEVDGSRYLRAESLAIIRRECEARQHSEPSIARWMPWPASAAPSRDGEAEGLRALIREWAEAENAYRTQSYTFNEAGALKHKYEREQQRRLDRFRAAESALRLAAGQQGGQT